MTDLDVSGIYGITCLGNGKIYIGSAKCFRKRWLCHRSDLRNCKHYNSYLQRSWNRYGEDNFVFGVIECVPVDSLIEREQYWIDYYNSSDKRKGFNANPLASSPLGMKHSEETKARMSVIHTGVKHSEETKAKMSVTRTGKKRGPHSEEHKSKISAACTGRKISEENKARLLSIRIGSKHSEEAKAKISAARKEYCRLRRESRLEELRLSEPDAL